MVIELCIFYPKSKELVLLICADEFYDVIAFFSIFKRYRKSNHCKIIIFKLITRKFAMLIEKRSLDLHGVTK